MICFLILSTFIHLDMQILNLLFKVQNNLALRMAISRFIEL